MSEFFSTGLPGPSQSRAQKDAPLGWKWCSACGETKKLAEFGSIVKRGRNTRPKTQCQSCCNARQRGLRQSEQAGS